MKRKGNKFGYESRIDSSNIRRVSDEIDAFMLALPRKETLAEFLIDMMDEKEMTAPEVYHRAMLDRQIFNKLIQYRNPQRASKTTLMQIAIGLKATVAESERLLATCGYMFDYNSTSDVAFLFCLHGGMYSMYDVAAVEEIIAMKQEGI